MAFSHEYDVYVDALLATAQDPTRGSLGLVEAVFCREFQIGEHFNLDMYFCGFDHDMIGYGFCSECWAKRTGQFWTEGISMICKYPDEEHICGGVTGWKGVETHERKLILRLPLIE